MGNHRKYSKWYERPLREQYILQMTHQLITDLQNKGALFYRYRLMDILYFNGQVVDLHRKKEVLAFLEKQNLKPAEYEMDVIELLVSTAQNIYIDIPKDTIGTLNGLKEPKSSPNRFMDSVTRNWTKEAICSGALSQQQGTP